MPVTIKPSSGAGSVTLEAQTGISSNFTLTLPGVSGTALTTGTTVTVAQGGTGLTSLTAGRIPYGAGGSGTDPFGSSANLTFDGTTLSLGNTVGSTVGAANKIQLYNSGSGVIYGFGLQAATLAYNSGDGAHVFSTGGASPTERMRITSTGTVNIVGAGAGGSTQAVSFNGSAPINSMVLDASGNLGIGTSSPACKLDVNGLIKGASILVNSTNLIAGANQLTIDYLAANSANRILSWGPNTSTAGNLDLVVASSDATTYIQAVRITAAGDLLVGTTTTGARLRVSDTANQFGALVENSNASFSSEMVSVRPTRSTTNGSFYAYGYYNNGAAAYRYYVIDSGAIYSTSGTVTVISDARLKENVRDLDTGLSHILKLRPRRFDWKENQGDGSKNTPGFIAQEVEEVMPDLVVPWNVTGATDDNHKGLATGNLIPTLVKAIQELAAEVAELKSKVQ